MRFPPSSNQRAFAKQIEEALRHCLDRVLTLWHGRPGTTRNLYPSSNKHQHRTCPTKSTFPNVLTFGLWHSVSRAWFVHPCSCVPGPLVRGFVQPSRHCYSVYPVFICGMWSYRVTGLGLVNTCTHLCLLSRHHQRISAVRYLAPLASILTASSLGCSQWYGGGSRVPRLAFSMFDFVSQGLRGNSIYIHIYSIGPSYGSFNHEILHHGGAALYLPASCALYGTQLWTIARSCALGFGRLCATPLKAFGAQSTRTLSKPASAEPWRALQPPLD